MNKTLPNDVFSDLLVATHQRVDILKKLPDQYKYLFIIEKLKVLDFWDVLYDKLHKIQITLRRETVLEEIDFNRFLFYIQIVGGFFAANGQGREDEVYAAACTYFLKNFYADKEITSEDYETIFFNAFPDSKS